MPSFRGNVGNLLQHWVLCEVLSACEDVYERLGFIDADSMAPFAKDRSERDAGSAVFDAVAAQLPGQLSLYEKAWLKLGTNGHEYPNSAAFVTATWRSRYALFLCEIDPATVDSLEHWARTARQCRACEGVEIAAGDWRKYIRGPLLPSSDLSFFSFDPYMFDRHGSQKPGHMNPTDLKRLVEVLRDVNGPVVLQLSTYSANNNNSQKAVRPVIESALKQANLVEAATVRVDGNMMSLVFTRDVDAPALASLQSRFNEWLAFFRSS